MNRVLDCFTTRANPARPVLGWLTFGPVAILLVFAYTVVVLVLVTDAQRAARTGTHPLRAVGLPGLDEPGVSKLGEKGLTYLSIGLAALFAGSLRRPGRMRRAVLLAALLLQCALLREATRYVEQTRYPHTGHVWHDLDDFEFVTHEDDDHDELFAREHLTSAAIDSFDELHRQVAARFRQHRTRLRQHWQERDDATLKTFFFLNTLTRLWAYGNRDHPNETGCVLCNEDNGWVEPATITVQTYLQSKIGCCTDYANLLKWLLDCERIPNRLTAYPGHVFNEVYLQGRWCVADANTGIFARASWAEIQNRPPRAAEPIRICLFEHSNTQAGGAQYRPSVGQFRQLQLSSMIFRLGRDQRVHHPKLPAFFTKGPLIVADATD